MHTSAEGRQTLQAHMLLMQGQVQHANHVTIPPSWALSKAPKRGVQDRRSLWLSIAGTAIHTSACKRAGLKTEVSWSPLQQPFTSYSVAGVAQ